MLLVSIPDVLVLLVLIQPGRILRILILPCHVRLGHILYSLILPGRVLCILVPVLGFSMFFLTVVTINCDEAAPL